jgi:hypothetical protein
MGVPSKMCNNHNADDYVFKSMLCDYATGDHKKAATSDLADSLPYLRSAIGFAKVLDEDSQLVRDLQYELKDNYRNQKCKIDIPDMIGKLISIAPAAKKIWIPSSENSRERILESLQRPLLGKEKKKIDWDGFMTR